MKKGYKETEIGEIPEEWELTCLESCVGNGFISDGDWIESKDQDKNGTIRLIQLADIGDGDFVDKSRRFINEPTYHRLKCTGLEANDILIARMPDPIGRACLLPKLGTESITAVDICIVRVIKNLSTFVCYVINSPQFRKAINQNISGSTRQRVPTGYLKAIPFPLPPLPEQKKIAEVLSSVDESIRATQAVIDQAKVIKQGMLNRLLTKGIGHKKFKGTEIGEIPVEWEVKMIGSVAQPSSGGTPSRSSNEYYGGNIPWLKSGELNRDIIDYTEETITEIGLENSSAKWAEKGSTVIAMYGATAGVVAFLLIRTTINQAILALNPSKDIAPYYLYYSMKQVTNRLLDSIQGSGQPNLNAGIIGSTVIPIPPYFEQNQISTILSGIDDAIMSNNAELIHLKKVKDGLMQDLLSGKKRVR